MTPSRSGKSAKWRNKRTPRFPRLWTTPRKPTETLLSAYESSVYVLREDQSYNPGGGLAHIRYFEFSVYRLKPGHDADWDEIVNIVKPALIKANPDDSWAMYARAYGAGGFAFVVVRVMKSAAEIDHAYADNPKFIAAVGAEGMKKLDELSAAAIDESETNLFIINPRRAMSDRK